MAVIESATNGVPPTGEEGQKNHLNGENHVNGSGVDESPADDTVLIAGGGPVGLLLAFVLAHYGVRSIILERNHTTTKWPKMDLTNIRSIELLRQSASELLRYIRDRRARGKGG